ncbi:uncharacterized protein M421DRAFT_50772 [Didymella exigua CBS 183.55]|uniref:Uncharacterized protein n=1 Tax=Didymella exigua CBS 183.55 TaxID=1150837 RepID=A0A6A5S2I6_9PLEO|nr:uncharacterized protein M421DRAFT_50772 [Didymella exigua CBS 183.55]KAF1934322.1 hypothetical protein M421DRAFT_50772 [Didymella exigua CBS 183.55]
MVFRPHRTVEFENDQDDHSSVSLAGIIKLQPSRTKTSKSWRSMQATDLGEACTTRGRIFSNLPDPIRLSEQMGKFDGEVVFIGHPNRDISAHQWSSSSFQWVNIGRYSHSRGKVEGSLASDRLRGIDEPHDTVEYFKLAAENRQALILESSCPKNQNATTEPTLHAGVDLVERPQVPKDPSIRTLRLIDQTQSEAGSTTHALLTKDVLEDPFIAAADQLPSTASYQPYLDRSHTPAKVEESRLTTPCLSATAVPYSQAPSGHGMLGTSKSSASTVNAGGVALHYSDPDGLRKTQQYEVANGLTQQVPTTQSFKGPFFTDSKPTTHDPTVSLSVHVSEEEKLMNWYRDGHRPARQKEYTKTLIAAAAASDKSRQVGAMGGVSTKLEDGAYANTGPFVRLYENLSEYVEEHRNGGGQSYFTRRWKAVDAQLREAGPEHSRSYFGKGIARPLWPRAALLRPSDGMWG